MTENPYEPPQTSHSPPLSATRQRAVRSFRWAFLLLLLPALYNYYAFDLQSITPAALPGTLKMLYRFANVCGFLLGGTLLWGWGMPMLELAARTVRAICARGTDRQAWLDTLYQVVGWMAYLAVPSAVLWVVWVYGFYFARIDFQTISWVIGIPAHILAASLYIPLIFRWYRLTLATS